MKPALRGVGEKRKDAVGDLRSSPIMAEEDDLTARHEGDFHGEFPLLREGEILGGIVLLPVVVVVVFVIAFCIFIVLIGREGIVGGDTIMSEE